MPSGGPEPESTAPRPTAPSGAGRRRREPGAEAGHEPDRLAAFSDGVMAVIITIMAFTLLKPPSSSNLGALTTRLPALLVYLLSFTFVGIYWVNHHHLLRATELIDGAVMWANLHLLFWLSLVPAVTAWMGKFYSAAAPASAWGVAAVGAAIAYVIMERAIAAVNGADSAVARAIGSEAKGSTSVLLYLGGIGLAWVSPYISYVLYTAVAVIWFVPDRRFARWQRSADQ